METTRITFLSHSLQTTSSLLRLLVVRSHFRTHRITLSWALSRTLRCYGLSPSSCRPIIVVSQVDLTTRGGITIWDLSSILPESYLHISVSIKSLVSRMSFIHFRGHVKSLSGLNLERKSRWISLSAVDSSTNIPFVVFRRKIRAPKGFRNRTSAAEKTIRLCLRYD